jgi:hypothetical protein
LNSYASIVDRKNASSPKVVPARVQKWIVWRDDKAVTAAVGVSVSGWLATASIDFWQRLA